MCKASGVPDGEGSAEGSTPGRDRSGHLNTIGTGTQRVTGAKRYTRKFLLNYTEAKSTTELEQLLAG